MNAARLQRWLGVGLLVVLTACVNTKENIEAAGFKSEDEARAFVPDFAFYAQQITPDEWREFYARFPEYFKDLQDAKTIGSTMEYHPWYTAYAFKWTSDRRRATWPAETRRRLAGGSARAGDDVFMLVDALGPPPRVVMSNWGSAMPYRDGTVYIIRSGKIATTAQCPSCWMPKNLQDPFSPGMTDDELIRHLRQQVAQ